MALIPNDTSFALLLLSMHVKGRIELGDVEKSLARGESESSTGKITCYKGKT